MATGTVRILLADRQSLFREAVRTALDDEPDLEVVAEAADGVQAVNEAERTSPAVALIDAKLPNCDGIRAAALIAERVPGCRVVVLADSEDEPLLLDAVEAGACGFLSKTAPLAELIEAARVVDRGEALIAPHLLPRLLDRLVRRRREQEAALHVATRLTRREREVLALVAGGGDNDAIAQRLVISPETARTHIQNVLSKLDVHSRLEAAAFVRRNGLLDDLAGTLA